MTHMQQHKNPEMIPQRQVEKRSISPGEGWEIALEEIEMRIKSAFPDFEICIVCIPHPSDDTKTIPILCYDSQNGNKPHPFDFSALFSDHDMAHLAPRILCRVDKFPKRNNVILRKELQKKVLKTMKFQDSPQHNKNS
jgi:hypothetical protein